MPDTTKRRFPIRLIRAMWWVAVPCAGGAVPGIVETVETTTVNATSNVPGHRYTWQDASGNLRSALMLDQTANRAGVLRQLKYEASGADRVCSAIPSNSNAIQGMGYVVNHLGTGNPWGNWTAGVSTAIGGTTTMVFAGKIIPTTVHWMFATGRSHPLFSVSQDARAHTAGNIGADSRSPYGTLQFAGDGLSQDCLIGGVSWGDTFKFVSVQANTTNESTTLVAASGWRYNEANTIPFTMAWASGVNAEQGTVATTSITKQDHGSDPRIYPATGFRKNQQDLNGPMISGDDWQYQMMNYPEVPTGGTYDKKIGWGTNFGMLGGFDNWGDTSLVKTEYSRHRDSVAPWTGSRTSGLFLAYSTFIVLGEHTGGYRGGATGQTVTQMEAIQAATFTAATGQVKTQGPLSPSVASSPSVTFSPVGYDASYSVWTLDAAPGSAVTMTLTPAAAKPLINPVFLISNYQSSAVGVVRINGTTAVPDVDFFASLDAGKHALWVTLNRTVSQATTLTVEKLPQTITFGALPDRTVGDPAYPLSATSSSGLAVTFASGNPSVATVTASTLVITGAGTATVTASQSGDATYAAAPDVPQTLKVLTPFEHWKVVKSLPPGITDGEDPDADGISILIEYALNMSPTIPDVLPVFSTVTEGRLAVAVTKNPTASDLTWGAEVSANLYLWAPATTTLNTPARFEASDILPITNPPNRFIRLRISHP
ncbi:MAG: hypothetical protein NTV46_06375 [Verrucomicrobia bacterium]|nr:hypothetical protein [Verrucomicrobiota bacterium]